MDTKTRMLQSAKVLIDSADAESRYLVHMASFLKEEVARYGIDKKDHQMIQAVMEKWMNYLERHDSEHFLKVMTEYQRGGTLDRTSSFLFVYRTRASQGATVDMFLARVMGWVMTREKGKEEVKAATAEARVIKQQEYNKASYERQKDAAIRMGLRQHPIQKLNKQREKNQEEISYLRGKIKELERKIHHVVEENRLVGRQILAHENDM